MLCMSYLIQNFANTQYSTRLNLRSRSAFLFRNATAIYGLLSTSSKAFNLPATNIIFIRQLNHVGNYIFRKLIKVLFPKPKFLKHTPIGINYPTSAHRESLRIIDVLLSKKLPSNLPNIRMGSFLRCPYFTGSQIAFTPIAGKAFFLALYKLLRMSLQMWFYWPRYYSITTHYTPLHSQWLFLKFLNKYFFKVYNI
jgi:hypothetical protein